MSRKDQHYSRGRKEYSRREPSRNGNRVLIVVEGDTEQVYFEAVRRFLRLPGARVVVTNPAATDPTGMARFAKKKAKEDDYDEIWIVCDMESAIDERHRQFEQCKTSSEFRGIRFIASNPSFEFWFILHFHVTTKSFDNAAQVTEYLKTRCDWKDYRKGTELPPGLLLKTATDAIPNAQKVRQKLIEDNAASPHTEVDFLVESLDSTAQEGNRFPRSV